MLLTVGRTGSNWLCTRLDAHPEILCHHELFNDQGVHLAWSARGAMDLGSAAERDAAPLAFLAEVWRQPRGARAVGFKLCPDQDPALFDALLPDPAIKKIILDRRNRVRIVVSRLIAERSGLWESFPDSPRAPHPPRIRVEAAELLERLAAIEAFYAGLRRRLGQQPCFALDYEQVGDDEVFGRLLAFLGVDALDRAPRGATRRQNSEALRAIITNFDALEQELRGSPIHPQLFEAHDHGP